MSFKEGDTVRHNLGKLSEDWPENVPSHIDFVSEGSGGFEGIVLINNHNGVHYRISEIKRCKSLLTERNTRYESYK